MKKFLIDLLCFHEITTCDWDKKAYVDAHRVTWYDVDWHLVKSLIHWNILDQDSENWETGERHYTLDESYYELSMLKRIRKLKENIKNGITFSYHEKLLDELLILEKKKKEKKN